MPGIHALLSPSSAHRWLNCTAAPLLEKDVEDKGSTFAEEGTLAHAYCAMKLKQYLGKPTDKEEEEIKQLNEQYHTGEMDEYTDTYKSIVIEKLNKARQKTKDAILLVEVQLDFAKYVPEAFGTADAVIIADGTMEVIDFKYGKGVRVEAHENPQMKIYALGAYEAFSFEYNINRIRMTIVQPRIDNLSEFEMTMTDLLWWARTELKPKADEAFGGKGKQVPGQWCQFCKVKAQCRALADTCIDAVTQKDEFPLISQEDYEQRILPILPTLKIWLSSVEEYTLKLALDGTQFKGFKLVEGRSVRKITDQGAVISILAQNGFAEDSYIKPTELRSITDLEKLIGKKRFAELCKDYIVKPQGKPTLVPEDDKRPAYNQASEDFKDINI